MRSAAISSSASDCASRLVMSGAAVRVVQELMAHKPMQVTCRYAHLAPSFEQEAVETLGNTWNAKVADAAAKADEAAKAASAGQNAA